MGTDLFAFRSDWLHRSRAACIYGGNPVKLWAASPPPPAWRRHTCACKVHLGLSSSFCQRHSPKSSCGESASAAFVLACKFLRTTSHNLPSLCAYNVLLGAIASEICSSLPISGAWDPNEATILTNSLNLKINVQLPPKWTSHTAEQNYACSKLTSLTTNYHTKVPLISHKLMP